MRAAVCSRKQCRQSEEIIGVFSDRGSRYLCISQKPRKESAPLQSSSKHPGLVRFCNQPPTIPALFLKGKVRFIYATRAQRFLGHRIQDVHLPAPVPNSTTSQGVRIFTQPEPASVRAAFLPTAITSPRSTQGLHKRQ